MPDARLTMLHTGDDDTQQLTELNDAAAIVPQLASPEDLRDSNAILLTAAPSEAASNVLLTWLDTDPQCAVIDLTQGLVGLCGMTITTGTLPEDPAPRVQIAHPAVVALSEIVAPLLQMPVERVAMAVIEPVSIFGATGPEQLAQQSTSRLRGESTPGGFGGTVLAFNQVAVDATGIVHDLTSVLPQVQSTATRCLSGTFHGLVVHVSAVLGTAASADALRAGWQEQPMLELVERSSQFEAVDQERVRLSNLTVAADGRSFSLTAMLDPLIVGGAQTALAVVESVWQRRVEVDEILD